VNAIYLLQLKLQGFPGPEWGCFENNKTKSGWEICIGDDNIHGNYGDDVIFDPGSRFVPDDANTGNPGNMLFGQEGNDDIQGGMYSDDIYGGLGDDRIWGGGGPDQLYGGGGGPSDAEEWKVTNPEYTSGDVPLGAGVDELYGELGNDSLTGAETKVGGDGDDTCFGDDGMKKVVGGVPGACDDGK
jgi:Ca2+-binding RTX toxin-like protein